MVRSIILTVIAAALCVAFFIFVEWYLNNQFDEFYIAVDALYEKVEEQNVNSEDADAVRRLWSSKREHLHIFIPHNDIAYVDYRLNEAFSYIRTEDYPLALANLEIVRKLAQSLPDNYKLKAENIF